LCVRSAIRPVRWRLTPDNCLPHKRHCKTARKAGKKSGGFGQILEDFWPQKV